MPIYGFSYVKLGWDPNLEPDLVGYRVYRRGEIGDWLFRGSSRTTEYRDGFCGCGRTYYYYITAVDIANNESGASNVIKVEVGWFPVLRDDATGEGNAKRLVQDKNGVIHFLFSNRDNIFYTSSSDIGESWSEPFAIGCGEKPALAIDKDSVIIYAVWVMNETVGEYLKYAKFDGVQWSEPVTLHRTSGTFYWGVGAPSIDVGDSLCYVAWESRTGEYHPPPGGTIPPVVYTVGLSLFSGYFSTKDVVPVLFCEEVDFLEESSVDTPSVIQASMKSPSLVLDNSLVPNILWDGLKCRIRFYTLSDTGWEKKEFPTVYSVREPNLSFYQGLLHCSWAEENVSNSEVYGIKYADRYPGMKTFVTEPLSVSRDVSFSAISPFFCRNHLIWSQKSRERFDIFESQFKDFEWSEPVNISEIDWADAKYPQLLYAKPYIYRVWTEGNELGYNIRIEKKVVPSEPQIVVKVGSEEPSPYTVVRDSFVIYGVEPYQSVDMSDSALVYEVGGLSGSPGGWHYRLKLVFYFEGSNNWKERIDIDNIWHHNKWVTSGEKTEVEGIIPEACLNDGKIRITITPKSNGAKAVLSWFSLEHYKSGGGSQLSGKGKTPLMLNFTSYPDPMKEKATIKFSLDKGSEVSLDVYDVCGRKVKRILNKTINKGGYTLKWNCSEMANGIYFYRLAADEKTFIKKFVVLK